MPAKAAQSLRATRTAWRRRIHSATGDPRQFDRTWTQRECPICRYRGRFWSYGSPPRAEAMCPHCMSLERHRLLQLMFDRCFDTIPTMLRVLHFAPEHFIRERLAPRCLYIGVDFMPYDVACACSMEHLPFPDQQFDLVIANHVLEHVRDERAAFEEIRRVMDRYGACILSVPQVFAWDRTYEDDSIVDPNARRLHFGQSDHRRLYGRDFAQRLCSAGFDVDLFQMDPESEIRFGLSRGEALYIGQPTIADETASQTVIDAANLRLTMTGGVSSRN